MAYDVYEATLDKLNDFDSWDVQGLISDVSARLRGCGDDEAAAVIDSLVLTIQDIDRMIRSGKRIDAKTIGTAARITERFYAKVQDAVASQLRGKRVSTD